MYESTSVMNNLTLHPKKKSYVEDTNQSKPNQRVEPVIKNPRKIPILSTLCMTVSEMSCIILRHIVDSVRHYHKPSDFQ
jgi:hypothetical protein